MNRYAFFTSGLKYGGVVEGLGAAATASTKDALNAN